MRADEPVGELTAMWARHATSDLAAARVLAADPAMDPGAIGFHAQQAIEKALKSVLVFEQIDFSRTHDLGSLVRKLPPGWAPGLNEDQLARISQFAAETRYPIEDWNDIAEPSRAEVEAALELAAGVITAILDRFAAEGLEIPR
jgi:HEPN domain-containing protein